MRLISISIVSLSIGAAYGLVNGINRPRALMARADPDPSIDPALASIDTSNNSSIGGNTNKNLNPLDHTTSGTDSSTKPDHHSSKSNHTTSTLTPEEKVKKLEDKIKKDKKKLKKDEEKLEKEKNKLSSNNTPKLDSGDNTTPPPPPPPPTGKDDGKSIDGNNGDGTKLVETNNASDNTTSAGNTRI
ncbi:hypothetical protein CROQUDRAFT_130034 [Cronartium quercuum f. sp. fusiforme G11]|uniref:Uncharacterized protein n=1 Tax=Cronartium quercuum f. sp. fusiforme G11 TaxID=708437 RepID=A0A9P6NSS6_9BASI|nr:hypothetical protein CROQUDRAFT_130034 [Cronartium quercuum f. sp. fusiforme G11]